MKIFITGGRGFIGRELIEVLGRDQHDITVLSRGGEHNLPTWVKVVNGDLTDSSCKLEHALEGVEIVFHCAGETINCELMRPLHVEGTQKMLRFVLNEAKKRSRPIHWVQLSSVGAYGPPKGAANTERVVTEETPTCPVGEYEITKTISDELVVAASKDGLLTYSIVRPANVFGKGMPNESLRSLAKIVRRGMFFYIGKPCAMANYVHVRDVVELLHICGFNELAKGKIFNISNDCTLKEFIDGIAVAVDVRRPWLSVPETAIRIITYILGKFIRLPITQERINALVGRTSYPFIAAKKELNFIPKISVPEAIGEVVQNNVAANNISVRVKNI